MLPEEDQAMDIGNTHNKLAEDWTSSSGDMLMERQTDTVIAIQVWPISKPTQH